MTSKNDRSSSACGSLLVALLVASPAPLGAAPPGASSPTEGVEAWLAGDAAGAAAELLSRTDREGVLNRGVALLYAGDVASAERELCALRAREPRFTPALRWLARARAKAAAPAFEATLSALLADSGADSRDFLWVGAAPARRRAGRPGGREPARGGSPRAGPVPRVAVARRRGGGARTRSRGP